MKLIRVWIQGKMLKVGVLHGVEESQKRWLDCLFPRIPSGKDRGPLIKDVITCKQTKKINIGPVKGLFFEHPMQMLY